MASKQDGAFLAYTSDFDDEPKYFDALISHSKSNEQKIYFSNASLGKSATCQPNTNSLDSMVKVIVFNNQAIKMFHWCKKFDDVDGYYSMYSPMTDRGHSYVVNLFKRATKPIEIRLDGEVLLFPVMGFTKVWNSAGGDAI